MNWHPVWLSLLVATAATVAGAVPAVGVAWWLERRSTSRAGGAVRSLVETTVMLPLVLPPVVTGYALLWLLGRGGPIGRWTEDWFGVSFVFNWKGAVVAAAVVAFPLWVRPVRAALGTVDRDVVDVARTLGAGPWDAFRSVTLPSIRGGVAAGAALAFARAMGEFGATILVAGNLPGRTQTIPLAIFDAVQTPGGAAGVWPLVAVSVAVAAAAVAIDRRASR